MGKIDSSIQRMMLDVTAEPDLVQGPLREEAQLQTEGKAPPRKTDRRTNQLSRAFEREENADRSSMKGKPKKEEERNPDPETLAAMLVGRPTKIPDLGCWGTPLLACAETREAGYLKESLK